MPAYLAGAIGVAGLTVGTVAGLVGLHKKSIGDDNCNDQTRTCNQKGVDANESARSLATASTVGLIAGVLGVGVGAYLWLTLPEGKGTALGVGGTDGATLQWRVRW